MRTELNGKTYTRDRRQMDEESRERANGFLPSVVAQVPKEELQRYLKCKRIGNYLLGKTIGEGSFARVKQGFHVLTGEKVAIKIIDKKQAHQDKYVARNMRREAKIMQMIRHPNIVQLLEVVETEHRYYLITELAAGGDLMDYICYRRKLGEVEVRKFIRQTVSAVHYLHQGGILHRDLKVENLLLDDDYNIKIIDFGLSNTMFVPSSDGQSTRQFLKTQCGSPAYAAPEILGHKPYGPEVDVWSIGVNMFAMLTGKLPYTAEPFHITTLYNKMKKNDMNVIPDHLSSSCKDLIQRFLTFNRDQRITLEEALGHEWLRKGYDGPVISVMFPNYPRDEDIDKNILRHMTDKMDFKQPEIIEAVTQNRSTSAATVYHLLERKLKKYRIRHPEKAKLITNAEPIKENTKSLRDSRGPAQEKENQNPIKKKSECTVATAVVCDFNDKEQKTQKEVKDSVQKKLEVPICRKRLSSASSENLSKLDGELSEDTNSPKDDAPDTVIFESEIDGVAGAEKDETCNIFSSAGIEISRKNSCNYSSVEVMAIKGRKLSLNLSHISVESKVTVDDESLKNTSVKNLDEHVEREEKEPVVEDKRESPRRIETMPTLIQEKTQKSSKHTGPNTPSIGKVSLINAKVISIPLNQTKEDSSTIKVKLKNRKFSLPQTQYFPPRNLGTNQQRQPIISPFSFTLSPSSTETKRRSKDSSALPPYGLCCQLTAVKAQGEIDGLASRGKEDKSRGDHAAQSNGLDARPARRSVHCSTFTEKGKPRRKTIASTGRKELLKSINNTLGKLIEVQEKVEPGKTRTDSLLLRSRLPPATLNGPKHESPVEGVEISLIQEHAAVERAKEKRNSGLKISCSVKDTHSHLTQVLSSSNSESNAAKHAINREKQNKGRQQEKAARKPRRRTIEAKVPIKKANDVLSRHDEGKNLRRHLRDEKYDTSHGTPRGGRASCDSLEEFI